MKEPSEITPSSDQEQEQVQLQVQAFLQNNPDYLQQHPELLETLNIPHNAGEASSLIERQVKILREKNQRLQQQLSNLIKNATANEQLLAQIQRLAKQLDTAEANSTTNIEQWLTEIFDADWTRLLTSADDLSSAESAALEACAPLIKDGPKSGTKLPAEILLQLQPESGTEALSLALIPLGEAGNRGVAILASSQQHRFAENHETLFLELLAAVLSLARFN